MDKVQALLVSSQNSEAKFIIRILEGKLRIGLAGQSVLIALAHASVKVEMKKNPNLHFDDGHFNEAENIIKSAYNELPCFDKLIGALLEHSIDDLPKYCHLTPGIPLKPMLAHPTKSITEVLSRFEGIAFTCEYKYDGERAQIHMLEPGHVEIFSRNLENMSSKYPDIKSRISQVA